MRRLALVVILLLLLGGSVAFLVYRFTRKPLPTPVGWKAHVTTVAGDGSPLVLSDPFGVAVAADGSIYFTDAGDFNRIQKIAPDGNITTIAGGAVEGFGDGAGDKALFNSPSGIAIAPDGNFIIADTGNNRIRRLTPTGEVSTVAGDGTAGYADGIANKAQFNGPIGVAVDARDNIYVADSYNDRIRLISPDGQVSTVTGKGTPGYADGDRNTALFDTPSGIVVANDNSLVVADTGNDRLRKISPDGNITTLPVTDLSNPIGLAITYDNFLYVTELDRARVVQITPDGATHVIAGEARFNQPAGIAIAPSDDGPPKLYVTDSGNYQLRKLDPAAGAATEIEPRPRLTNETLREQSLMWPVDPQQSPHEVVATMGEVRGSFDSDDSRHHLHSGLDVFGAYGDMVRAVRSEKINNPLSNWGFDSINEGFRVGVVSYIHIHVGRDKDGKMFDDPRFIPVNDAEGKLARVRLRRGTRFRPGEAVGTINKMYHVHMNIGPPGGEVNPLSLSPIGFKDSIAPIIEKDGIQLFDSSGARFTEKQEQRLLVSGSVRIVVDAFDRTNMNPDRRRLGLYRLGYQLLNADGTPAPGFNDPRITLLFNLLPRDREATKVAYAAESGITVYGSKTTRFLYEVTNTVKDGHASPGSWDTSQLPKGDYILRIIAADYSGNEVQEGRDVLVRLGVNP